MSSVTSNMAGEKAPSQRQSKEFTEVKARVVIVVLLALALGLWLWFGLAQSSVDTDKGLSILGAQAILEHGYPLMPSGNVYHRGYLPHYFLAGFVGVLGVNDLAIMLPGLVMALASLWVVYLFSKDIMGNSWFGIGAVCLMLLLGLQTFYATNPRMYASVQFFTLLAAYGGWRGYIKGDYKFQWVTILAIGAAMLSHRVAGALVLAIPMSVCLVAWIQSRQRPRLYLAPSLVAVLLIAAIVVFMYYFDPNAAMQAAGNTSQQAQPTISRFNLDPFVWAKHLRNYEMALPFGLAVIPASLFVLISRLRRTRLDEDYGALYALSIFAVAGLLLLIINPRVTSGALGGREWFFVLPLSILFIVYGMTRGVESFLLSGKTRTGKRHLNRIALVMFLIGGVLADLGALSLTEATQHSDLVTKGFGLPCRDIPCSRLVEEHYARLGEVVKPEDMVISSNPAVTQYYLGRVNGLLRQQRYEGNVLTVRRYESDIHFDMPVVSTATELRNLADGVHRTWIIVDHKISPDNSQELQDLLQTEYSLYLEDRFTATYVSDSTAE